MCIVHTVQTDANRAVRYHCVVASLREGSTPVEVRLNRRPIDVAADVRHDDGTTEPLQVTAVSVRGAKIEVTARLHELGYLPAARWRGLVRVFRHAPQR